MRAADGIIVLGSSEPSYTPSKMAGCFLANRPCLVVAPAGSGADRLNSELGLGSVLDPEGGTPRALEEFLKDLGNPSPAWKARRSESLFSEHYTARARNRELAQFMDSVLVSSSKH
jgi:hypothetical protein